MIVWKNGDILYIVRCALFIIFIAIAIAIVIGEEEKKKNDDYAESLFCVRLLMVIKMDIYIRQSSVPCIIYSYYTLYITL